MKTILYLPYTVGYHPTRSESYTIKTILYMPINCWLSSYKMRELYNEDNLISAVDCWLSPYQMRELYNDDNLISTVDYWLSSYPMTYLYNEDNLISAIDMVRKNLYSPMQISKCFYRGPKFNFGQCQSKKKGLHYILKIRGGGRGVRTPGTNLCIRVCISQVSSCIVF